MGASAWLSIVLALTTVLGTLGGVIITQRASVRRDKEQWERTREMERDRWAREDALRTFEQQRSCYIEFEEHLRSAALDVYHTGYGPASRLDDDWKAATYQSLLRLQIFATPEASKAANLAYDALGRWGDQEGVEDRTNFYNCEHSYDKAHAEYLRVIRRDLKIYPETA
jgi:hypothetical protein